MSVIFFVQDYISNSVNVFPLILFVLSLFMLVGMPLLLKYSSKKMLQTSALLRKTQTFKIHESGIDSSTESSNSSIKWCELYKANETKENFLFFISKTQAFILPKKCLDGDEDYFNIIRSYMKNAPVPKEDRKGFFSKYRNWIATFIAILITILIFITIYLSLNP